MRRGTQQRQEERVDDGQVVAGENRSAVLRDVLHALDRRPAEQPQQRTEKHELGPPVQHLGVPLPARWPSAYGGPCRSDNGLERDRMEATG